MASINANLDDLKAGIEAGSRAANTLHTDTTKLNGLLNAPLHRAVVRHVRDLQACTRDQRAAMQELREGIARLQKELKRPKSAVRPPPIMETDRQPQVTKSSPATLARSVAINSPHVRQPK